MGTSFEDLVADSLHRRAAAVQVPANLAGLAHRARARRRRQFALRSGLTMATAAGLAIAIPLATATGPRQAAPGALPARTVAYVVGHSERSIAASAAAKVQVVHSVYRGFGAPFAAPVGSRVTAHVTTTWSYGARQREQAYAADGRPVLAEAFANSASSRGRGAETGADYVTRTWWRLSAPAVHPVQPPPPARCLRELADPMFWPGETPSVRWLRYYLRCGFLRLAGHQRVDGIDAIKIVSVGMRTLKQAIWIDPATYLPVRTFTFVTAGTRWSILASYHWLPATPRNLGLVNLAIPAGFRQVKFIPWPVAVMLPF